MPANNGQAPEKARSGPVAAMASARKYLSAHGGLSALPGLCAKVANTVRGGGIPALLAKVRKFNKRVDNADIGPGLFEEGPAPQRIRESLARAFSHSGILIIDHMYGGGANAYRENRIREVTASGQPALLLAWDFFNGLLRARAILADGQEIRFHTTSLKDIASQNFMRFRHVLVNELVLWSAGGIGGNYLESVPALLECVAEIKNKSQAWLEIALHDYYPLCPNYTLLKNGREYCGIPDNLAVCAKCLAHCKEYAPAPVNPGQWRRAWQSLFDCADEIRAFSRASLEIFEKRFKLDGARVKIIPHQSPAPLRRVAIPDCGPMRIGIIGRITRHKGADIARGLAEILAPEEKLVIIGALEGKKPARAIVHGEYNREELPGLVEKYGITVALIPSVWPETFCYAAQECMEMNLPLAVFPLGAQAERAKGYARGKVAEEASAAAALRALRELDGRRQIAGKANGQ